MKALILLSAMLAISFVGMELFYHFLGLGFVMKLSGVIYADGGVWPIIFPPAGIMVGCIFVYLCERWDIDV